MSYNLFCTHPPSKTSFRITLQCLSVHVSDPAILLYSIPHTRVWFAYFLQKVVLTCCRSIFFTSRGHHCPSNNNVCHCGHLMPRSRVSHTTAPANPHVRTSKICFLHASFCSVNHLPIHTPSAHACLMYSFWKIRFFLMRPLLAPSELPTNVSS